MGTKTCFVINILQKIVRIDRILLFWVNFPFKCLLIFFFKNLSFHLIKTGSWHVKKNILNPGKEGPLCKNTAVAWSLSVERDHLST